MQLAETMRRASDWCVRWVPCRLSQNLLGNPTFATAAALAATEALEELLVQGRPSSMDLSRALFDATMFRGGSAELVQRLIDLRADVDFQLDLPRDWSRLGRLLLAVKSWQQSRGRTSTIGTDRLSLAWQHAADADHPVCSVRRRRGPDRGRRQTGSLQLPEVDRGGLCAWAVDPTLSAAGPGGRLVRVPKGVFACTQSTSCFSI